MLNQVKKLSSYQKEVLLREAALDLESWEEVGEPVLKYDGYYHYVEVRSEDPEVAGQVMVLWKCDSCGRLMSGGEEVSEYGECHNCGAPYYE